MFNSRSSFFKSLKSVQTKKTNVNPERYSTRKKVKPVYYKNDHHKVHEWLNFTQNEFHQNNSLLINSSSDEDNDDDVLDKTYNINTELICSDSESEPGTVYLLFILLIHEDCHSFYQNLKTSKEAAELPSINSDFSSDEG